MQGRNREETRKASRADQAVSGARADQGTGEAMVDQGTGETMADQSVLGATAEPSVALALGPATKAIDTCPPPKKCIGENKLLKSPEGLWRVFRRSGHLRALWRSEAGRDQWRHRKLRRRGKGNKR